MSTTKSEFVQAVLTGRIRLIWVYGPDNDGVMAFTDFGIETLTGLIEIHKANPDLLKRSSEPE